ncbi:hypothetical protein Tco_0599601 [Tanacetum coccineum]
MDSNFTNENDPWEYSLDIDDYDLHLTPVMHSSSSAHVEPSPYTPNPVRIIPGPAGLVQRARLLKENVFILDTDGALMSTEEYMQKVVEDVGEDADFNSGTWVSATNYMNAFGGTVTGCLGDIDNFLKREKLEQVVAIVKSCSPNALEDLNVTLKDLSGTVPGTIHYKVLDVSSYEKDIIVGAAMILVNVSVFTPNHQSITLTLQKETWLREKTELALTWRCPLWSPLHSVSKVLKIKSRVSSFRRRSSFAGNELILSDVSDAYDRATYKSMGFALITKAIVQQAKEATRIFNRSVSASFLLLQTLDIVRDNVIEFNDEHCNVLSATTSIPVD